MSGKGRIATIGLAFLFVGCSSASEEDERIDETIDNLIEAGFPEDDIQVENGSVYVGRDAEVSLEASREMLDVDDSLGGDEQYRTRNLVSRSLKTICINGFSVQGTLSVALNLAIENYNQLGLTFRMRRITTTAVGCDTLVSVLVGGGNGGSAGFPSGGRPYPFVQIGAGLADFGVNTAEFVITHELGHAVGLRHSDFFDRSISCGNGGNEGGGAIGAIHIPNTPTGATVGGSVMNSCFRASETGEFTSSDRTALRTLY